MSDVVIKIKEWDEMEKEYGLTAEGNINTDRAFTTEMEELLPKNRTIWTEWNDVDESYVWLIDDVSFFALTYQEIEEVLKEEDYPEYYI